MRKLKDSFSNKGQRKNLVDILRNRGIKDENVLQAILDVPRHYFVSTVLQHLAYEDRALSIDQGQTISQPYTVAFQSELLKVNRFDKILEIGTGSGYQYAILQKMGVKIFSIERHKKLFDQTRDFLAEYLGYQANVFYGDGTLGLDSFSPFDKILVTAAAPEIPSALLDQLRIGGYLVIPVGDRSQQKMLRITKISETENEIHEFDVFKFVPLIGEMGWRDN